MAGRNHVDDLAVADKATTAAPGLPLSCPPRGLSRVQAAEYVGVKPTLFDEMVGDHRMPSPHRANSKAIWDRMALDEALVALPSDDDANPWDRGISA